MNNLIPLIQNDGAGADPLPFKESVLRSFANTVIAGVLNNNEGAIKMYATIKATSDVCEKITSNEDFKKKVLDEINILHKDERTFNEAKLGITNVGGTYDFSKLKIHADAKAKVKAIEVIAKLAYDTQTAQSYTDENGQIFMIEPSEITKNVSRETPTISFK